jgi:hypothetical protein
MRVLIGCEASGVVRRAFRAHGHEAWSCDLLPTDDQSPYHLQCDIRTVLHDRWDLAIFHPPCTHLAVSGARWFADKTAEQEAALDFVARLLQAPIPRICVENPVSVIASRIRPPDQTIQPWLFGHPEAKRTCLWLKNLPCLRPTTIVEPSRYRCPSCQQTFAAAYGMYGCSCLTTRVAQPLWDNMTPSRQNNLGPTAGRAQARSRTYAGVAEAMAQQWGRCEQAALVGLKEATHA